jgi:RNA polymerase sigma factor (sigma-70 family)
MIDSEAFAELMTRVRAGDQNAAAEMVRQYEPLIRREVRLRLQDPRLRTALETLDVCQSVMASFFVRANLGEYELDEPQQLVRLLVTMTKNKVASTARREFRQKRDRRRTGGDDVQLLDTPGQQATPSKIVADRELLELARGMLPREELRMADLRGGGSTWEQVAEQLGGTAHACRVRFGRAVRRVLLNLGLADSEPD